MKFTASHLESMWNRRDIRLATPILLIAIIAGADWNIAPNVSLGFLYFLPMLAAGYSLARRQVLFLAVACTALREMFSTSAWDTTILPGLFTVFVAYSGVGLFTFELRRNRRLALEHVRKLEKESALRREMENQLHALVESSP